MEKQNQAYTYAIIAVLFWATVASAFKISLRYLNFIQLLFYASLVSTIILIVILSIQRSILSAMLKSFVLHFAWQ